MPALLINPYHKRSVTIGNTLGEEVLIEPDWKDGSVFRKLLELANWLPERNQPVDVLTSLTFTCSPSK